MGGARALPTRRASDLQPPAADRTAEDGTRKRLLKALDDAGIPILVGTDTGVPDVLPGFSIHEELREVANAGLRRSEEHTSELQSPCNLVCRPPVEQQD